MASLIKIKRSDGTAAPSTLAAGELAYSFGSGNVENNGGRLFFGTGGNEGAEKQIIGGKYFTDFLDHVPGTLTASSALLIDSNSKIDNFKVDNLDFDGNTISSTNTDGAVVLNPNGNGKVEFNFANNAAAFASITGATATQYKDNITTATDDNAIPNKKYVDDLVSTAQSDADLTVSAGVMSDDETPVLVTETVNLTTEILEIVGGEDVSVSVAKEGNKVTFTVDLDFDLDQDIGTTDDVTFNSITAGELDVDNININGNTISSTDTNGNISITPDGTGLVVAANLEVTDLTSNRGVITGTNGRLLTNEGFVATPNGSAIDIDITGSLDVDNVSVDGNTISTTNTNGKLTLAPNGTGVVEVDSDALTTTETTFNLVNATATTVNFAGAATTLSIGAGTGTATINNTNTVVTGDLAVNGGDLTTSATTFNLLNTTATTVNFAGAGTAITIGAASSGTTTVRNDLVVSGDTAVNGGDLTTTATTFNLVNNTATTVNFAQGASAINIGASSGIVTFGDDVTVTGDLIVNGTTTTINSTTLVVSDPLIKLADGNAANSLDIGFFGQYNTSSFTGLFRDASDSNKYKLFATGTVTDNVVDTTTGFSLADLVVGTLEGTIDGGVY
jgi:hypothetical protein